MKINLKNIKPARTPDESRQRRISVAYILPLRLCALTTLATVIATSPSLAQKSYDPGVSDSEIKIGNIAPYTGWGSDYSSVARAEAAYFQMINDRGGINGRKINFI